MDSGESVPAPSHERVSAVILLLQPGWRGSREIYEIPIWFAGSSRGMSEHGIIVIGKGVELINDDQIESLVKRIS